MTENNAFPIRAPSQVVAVPATLEAFSLITSLNDAHVTTVGVPVQHEYSVGQQGIYTLGAAVVLNVDREQVPRMWIKKISSSQISPRLWQTLPEATRIIRYLCSSQDRVFHQYEYLDTSPSTDYLVHLYDAFLSDSTTVVNYMFKFYPGGTLLTVIGNRELCKSRAKDWSLALMETVSFMAGHGVCHRGIRLDNILLEESQGIRLGGFSSAVMAYNIEHTAIRYQQKVTANRRHDHYPWEGFRLNKHDPRNVDPFSSVVVLMALEVGRKLFDPTCPSKYSLQWRAFRRKYIHKPEELYLRKIGESAFMANYSMRGTADQLKYFEYFTALPIVPKPAASAKAVQPAKGKDHKGPSTKTAKGSKKSVSSNKSTSSRKSVVSNQSTGSRKSTDLKKMAKAMVDQFTEIGSDNCKMFFPKLPEPFDEKDTYAEFRKQSEQAVQAAETILVPFLQTMAARQQ